MTPRRSARVALALVLLCASAGGVASAQTRAPKMPRIGYVEGQTIQIEYRYADGRYERLPELAAELVRLNPDAILAQGDPVIASRSRSPASGSRW